MAAIHLFGGTSDARALCAVLDQLQLDYSVSVATDTGRELAGDIGGSVHVGRLDEPAMIDWLATRGVKWVIDAAHPYASALHANIRAACQALDLRLLRFERPSEIESIVHPLLTVVDDIAAAFGGYLGIKDKDEREVRKANVKAIVDYFGVAKATELDADNYDEALRYLQQYIDGETPDFDGGDGDEGGDDDEALV